MAELVTIRRALISVSDKRGLDEFARTLAGEFGVELISTGGTARFLRDLGLAVTPVDALTGQPEILDGRVKTLHPVIHGGLLADRDRPEHMSQLASLGAQPIDLVAINLYPFEATIAREGVTDAEAIEQIDIGGPAMLRASAKNHGGVCVACDPGHYSRIIEAMRTNGGAVPILLRRELAAATFALTARYDELVAAHLAGGRMALRYGENPHQSAHALRVGGTETSVLGAQQLHGKELSYNNLLDASAALDLVQSLARLGPLPAAVVVKHTNPCGCGVAGTISAAIDRALEGDPLAAYGGILCASHEIDEASARRLSAEGAFLEVIAAPSFSDAALAILRDRWKNARLLELGPLSPPAEHARVVREVPGGRLVQHRDTRLLEADEIVHAAGPAPDAETIEAVRQLDQIGRVLWSNAVCIGRAIEGGGCWLVGVGAGQVDRMTASRIAAEKAGERAIGAIAFSDAFFPFPDGPELLIEAGVRTIVHPGGSKRDGETFALCQERGVTCLTTGLRRFRH